MRLCLWVPNLPSSACQSLHGLRARGIRLDGTACSLRRSAADRRDAGATRNPVALRDRARLPARTGSHYPLSLVVHDGVSRVAAPPGLSRRLHSPRGCMNAATSAHRFTTTAGGADDPGTGLAWIDRRSRVGGESRTLPFPTVARGDRRQAANLRRARTHDANSASRSERSSCERATTGTKTAPVGEPSGAVDVRPSSRKARSAFRNGPEGAKSDPDPSVDPQARASRRRAPPNAGRRRAFRRSSGARCGVAE